MHIFIGKINLLIILITKKEKWFPKDNIKKAFKKLIFVAISTYLINLLFCDLLCVKTHITATNSAFKAGWGWSFLCRTIITTLLNTLNECAGHI